MGEEMSGLLTRQEYMEYIVDNNLGWRVEYQATGLAVTAIAKAQLSKLLKHRSRPELREKLIEIKYGKFTYQNFLPQQRKNADLIMDEIDALYPDEEYLLKQLHLADKNYSELKSAFDEQIEQAKRKERERIIKEIEEKGIWAQVYFEVKESEETMWCLFKGDWETLRDE